MNTNNQTNHRRPMTSSDHKDYKLKTFNDFLDKGHLTMSECSVDEITDLFDALFDASERYKNGTLAEDLRNLNAEEDLENDEELMKLRENAADEEQVEDLARELLDDENDGESGESHEDEEQVEDLLDDPARPEPEEPVDYPRGMVFRDEYGNVVGVGVVGPDDFLTGEDWQNIHRHQDEEEYERERYCRHNADRVRREAAHIRREGDRIRQEGEHIRQEAERIRQEGDHDGDRIRHMGGIPCYNNRKQFQTQQPEPKLRPKPEPKPEVKSDLDRLIDACTDTSWIIDLIDDFFRGF